jgi:chorismate mutase/prephenate dehydratase
MELNLQDIRGQLDQIDDQLIGLFARRMRLVSDVAAYKKENGLPILDSGRERQIINRVSLAAGEDLEHYAKLLYQTLFSVSRAYQARQLLPKSTLMSELERAAENVRPRMPERVTVACQGTEGAYSQKITDRMFEFADILYMNTFNAVFNAVEKGMCPFGVLPIENRTAGSVTQVYDLMEKHRFHIVKAARQRIDHRLLALPGVQIEDIREVVSHEQALRQCGAFLAAHPKIKVTAMENTAKAAAFAAASGGGIWPPSPPRSAPSSTAWKPCPTPSPIPATMPPALSASRKICRWTPGPTRFPSCSAPPTGPAPCTGCSATFPSWA